MKTIGITGYAGNIGSRLVKMEGCEPLFCNILNENEVTKELHRVKPDVILHLAAETRVDWCEQHYENALETNVKGTAIVCEQAEKAIGAGKVVVISSDHVFNGRKGFYEEGDEPDPINNYGMSKLGAESIAKLYGNKIVRLSRCFDSKSRDIAEYLKAIKHGEDVYVPSHMFKSYAHTDFVADSLYQYIHFSEMLRETPEILHISGDVNLSFHELIHSIAHKLFGILAYGHIVPRGDESGYAPRPFMAGLNPALSIKLGFPSIRITDSIQRFCDGL